MNMTDIKFYLQVFVRRLPYFLVVFLFITAAGLSLAVMMPAVYRASSTILVEPGQISEDLAQSTVEVESMQVIQIIRERLTARETLLDVARRYDVFADAGPMTATDTAAAMRARLEFSAKNLGDRRDPAPAIELAFEAPDPALAADVTNEFVTLVLQANQRLRTDRATDTLQFFENEVERLGSELDRISGDILAFKNDNLDALPESLEFRRAEQSRLQERLVQLERETATLRESRARLIEVYESTGRLVETQRVLSPAEQELQRLRAELEQQLVVFSDSNPRIVLLKNRVAALERQVAAQSGADDTTPANPATGELDLQLRDYDARLAYLDSETERLRTELAALSESIRATPVNEIQLSALERRYENIQGQYNTAVARLASAATGERIELLSKGERFSVVEQAVPPTSPDRPNRLLIAAASVVAGIGAGLGLVLLLELLNGAIRRPEDLARKLDIQAFGAVPYIRTRREVLVKRAVIGSAVVTAVVILPAVTYAVHVYYMPLDLLLMQVAERTGMDGVLGKL